MQFPLSTLSGAGNSGQSPLGSVAGLVLIDAALPDLHLLLGGLQPGYQAIPVQPEEDALQVLTAAVERYRAQGALEPHWRLAVVAHGTAGRVLIGRAALDASSVRHHASAWMAMAPATVELYSCYAGAGVALTEALSRSSGAFVAASSDVVGHSSYGGHWLLADVTPAHITADATFPVTNAVVPFSRAAREAWSHTLILPPPSSFYYSSSGSGDGTSAGSPSNNVALARTTLQGSGTVYVVNNGGHLPLSLQNGDNISLGTISLGSGATYGITLDPGASVTMTAAQHNSAVAISGANNGTETINLTTAATITGGSSIENYVLSAGSQQFNAVSGNESVDATSLNDNNILTLTGSPNLSLTVAGADVNAGSYSGIVNLTSTFPNQASLVGGSSFGDEINSNSLAGNDTVNISSANTGTLNGSNFSSFENLSLGDGNDVVNVNGGTSGIALNGELDLGDGNNSLNMTSVSGSIQDISSGLGNDTISLNGSTVNDDFYLDMGDGSDNLLINNASTVNSDYINISAGSGDDNLTIDGASTINSDYYVDINTGAGDDDLDIDNASTINSDYTVDINTGDGNDNLYIDGASAINVSEYYVDINTGDGSDNVFIEGASTISADDDVYINTGDQGDYLYIDDNSVIDAYDVEINTGDGSDEFYLTGGSTINAGDDVYINTGDGEDDLYINNASTINSDYVNINTGDGEDDLDIYDSTISASFGGTINTGDGEDHASFGGSLINSNLEMGAGEDLVTIFESTIGGSINAGAGEDFLSVAGASVAGDLATGSGDDFLLLGASSIEGSLTNESGNDLLISAFSTIDGGFTGGGEVDTLALIGTSVSGDVNTGAGDDALGFGIVGGLAALASGAIATGNGEDLIGVGLQILPQLLAAGLAGSIGEDSSLAPTITGAVNTGEGNDLLAITEATINGDVDAGSGDDIVGLGLAGSFVALASSAIATGNGEDLSVPKGNGEDLAVGIGNGEDLIGAGLQILPQLLAAGLAGSIGEDLSLAPTITGAVNTGEGNDLLAITEATINGDVDTESGDDIVGLGLAGSFVALASSAVATGNGEDLIGAGLQILPELLAGGLSGLIGEDYSFAPTITGAVNTGEGNDLLAITEATINGDVDTGDGDDIVGLGLAGSFVALASSAVATGNGEDLIGAGLQILPELLAGGLPGSIGEDLSLAPTITGAVNTGEGNDLLAITEATINGNVDTGSGDDVLAIFNSKIISNTGTASSPAFASPSTNPFGLDNVGSYADPTFADIDGDGDLDAFIGNQNGDTLFFSNTGTASSPAFASPSTNPFGLENVISYAAPTFADIDGDGDLDAFIGNENGDTLFFSNTGTASSPAFASPSTNPFGLENVGSYARPIFADIDGDGDLDAFIGNNDGTTLFFSNAGTASSPAFASPSTNPFGLENVDFYADPTLADIDIDGDLDAFIGDVSGNTLFFSNNPEAVTTGSSAINAGAGEDYATINSSIIDGDVDMGAGEDDVYIGESTIGGSINAGVGEDYANIDSSIIDGDVDMGAGEDNVYIVESTIGGSINAGVGEDNVYIGESTIGGSINAGAGEDSLFIFEASVDGDLSTGSENDFLSLGASSIAGSLVNEGGDDLLIIGNSIVDSGITGGGDRDNILLAATSVNSDVNAGAGDDVLTLTSSPIFGGEDTPPSAMIDGDVDMGAGDDTLNLNSGDVTITGDVELGEGSDVISYEGNSGPVSFTVSGIDSLGVGSSDAAEAAFISGTVDGYEKIIGSDADGSDSDTGDLLIDETGNSTVTLTGLGVGSLDAVQFESFENIDLNSGDDTLQLQLGASLTGSVNGGDGTDAIDYADYGYAVTINLSNNQATSIYGGEEGGLINFENAFGSDYADLIEGDSGDNVLSGYGSFGTSGNDGSDVLVGKDGADTFYGSDGNDLIYGGAETTDGEEPNADGAIDVLTYLDEEEGVVLTLTGVDRATVAGIDNSTDNFTYSTNELTGNGTGLANTYTLNYTTATGDATITAASEAWTNSAYGIEQWQLTNQNDLIVIDPSGVFFSDEAGSGQIDGAGGFDVLDYSSFQVGNRVFVNLSNAPLHFDINRSGDVSSNGDLSEDDISLGEYVLESTRAGSRINVSSDDEGEGGSNGIVSSGSYSSIEGVIGGADDDVIAGDDNANLLVGNAGDDLIAGLGGADTILGGDGDEYIVPGDGNDFVNAGRGINIIRVTSSDLGNDTYQLDPNGINVYQLLDVDATPDVIELTDNSWIPNEEGVDLVDGGLGTIAKDIEGTPDDDFIDFGAVATRNIAEVAGGDGDDTIGTSSISKLIATNYSGGAQNVSGDALVLNLSFDQLVAINQGGRFTSDVRAYTENPTGFAFSTPELNITAEQFERAGIAVVTPRVEYALQGDPAAITTNRAVAVEDITLTAGEDFRLAANANANSEADALSVAQLSSALVLADQVRGVDNATFTIGAELTGSAGANHTASALASTGDARTDAVLIAYGLGMDRSAITAGTDVTLSLNGSVTGDSAAVSRSTVADADGIVEVAGSRDSSFTAGDALNITASATSTQDVSATNIDGLSLAGLASRAYGIDDSNGTDAAPDGITAGSDLTLSVVADAANSVSASTTNNNSLGSFTLVNNGTASSDRLTTSLLGTAFPLISGDRIRFVTGADGIEAGRDYYVINPMAVSGDFGIASTPGGEAINLTASGASLQAYRPADASADAAALATGVDLNRTTSAGLLAGTTLSLDVSAAQEVESTATSVAGDAVAGLNRLGSLNGIDLVPFARVVGLDSNWLEAGDAADLEIGADLKADGTAFSISGDATTELNGISGGILDGAGTDTELIAGRALTIDSGATNLDLSATATSTDGLARALAGAGAGAAAVSGTYADAVAMRNSSATAGTALTLEAAATMNLEATASTTGGDDRILSGVTAVDAGDYLEIFNHRLNEGDVVQLSGSNAASLSTDTDYVTRLVVFGDVDPTTDTIAWGTNASLADGTPIRFGLNSSGALNATTSPITRYGIDLGATYYVFNDGAGGFQLATDVGGLALVDLTEDVIGIDDPLIDIDRIQLSETAEPDAPLVPIGAATNLTLIRPSAAVAMAGSRQDGALIRDTDAIETASVIGVDGNTGTSLVGGSSVSISALADGLLSAFALNVDDDAIAAAGTEAFGLRDAAITAGTDATIEAMADLQGTAAATTTGTVVPPGSPVLDNAVANLNLSGTGLLASENVHDITIGADGTINVAAEIDGSSTATGVTTNSDALAVIDATGLYADDAGISITIGGTGLVDAAARVGTQSAPLLVSATSNGVGDATAQTASDVFAMLGTYATDFTQLQSGAEQSTILANAQADFDISAFAIDGSSEASLTDSAFDPSDVVGIQDIDLTLGAGTSSLDVLARGGAELLAQAVQGDATSSASTTASGVLSSLPSSPLSISFSENGRIASIAAQSSVADALTVYGNAVTSLTNASTGVQNVIIDVGDNLQMTNRATSSLRGSARSVHGSASS